MKKTSYLLIPMLFFLMSCSTEDCHECHIAFMNASGVEIEGEIGEFCGENLEDVENNGYHLNNDLVVGNDIIPAGHYDASEIHCEEHAH